MSQADIAITAEPVTEAVCKFTLDQPVYPDRSFAFPDADSASGSPLAERLFQIDGISRLVVFHNQVTVTKGNREPWPDIARQVGAALREHIGSGDDAVSEEAWNSMPPSDEIRERVQRIIDTEINPSVAGHGGIINLINVQDNMVFIQMGGGCQGCGQANVTLKYGVENAIRASIPEVGEILDVTDHAAGRNPYYTPSKK